MKINFQFAGIILLCCFAATTANFSLESRPGTQSIFAVYEATTPCDESLGNMMGMVPGFKCEMVKWNLTLYGKSNMETPATFDLTCTYGSSKQGTRGFAEG